MSSTPNEESVRLELVLGNGHRLIVPQVKATLEFYDDPDSPVFWGSYLVGMRPFYTLDIGKFYNYTVIQGSGSVDTPIYDRMMREKEYYD